MKVGSKVVCIDDKRNGDSTFFQNWIESGETYTIRRSEGSIHQGPRVLLDEVVNTPVYVSQLGGKVEPGFSTKRFVSYEDYVMGNLAEESVEVEATCEY